MSMLRIAGLIVALFIGLLAGNHDVNASEDTGPFLGHIKQFLDETKDKPDDKRPHKT